MRPTRPYTRGPSLRDRIRPLAMQRLAPAIIAAEIDASPDSVRGVLSRMRRSGENIPRHASGQPELRLSIGPGALAAIESAAAERGVDARDLASSIVRAVARDGLIAAVLD